MAQKTITAALALVMLTTALTTYSATARAIPGSTRTIPAASSSTPGVTLRYQAGARLAASYARQHGMTSGIAVLDNATGTISSAGNADRLFPAASVVKTMIATRLLLSGQMHGRTKTLARSMITHSDNAAAWLLYPKVGRDALLPWLARHYHLTRVGAAPSMAGVWGSTRITARGLVRFYGAVRHDRRVWPWLGAAMHAYTQRSTGGEPNAFGIASVAPHSAIKNGWDVNRDIHHPTNAIINSTGFVGNDRYAVAILSEGPGRLYYHAGEKIVTREARLLLVRAQPVSAVSAVSAVSTRWRATIVLDPGHNGGNSRHISAINRLVYAGYGHLKPCNTTGTATNAGYPEHAFTWNVANRVRTILLAHRVRVVMTRASDSGVGPCVNTRAKVESRAGIAAAIAIHADGAASNGHGFHICVDSRRPEHASAATVARTKRLDGALRSALVRKSALSVSTYLGSNGYFRRADLAGLNLSTKPTAFLELGNMRNAGDAAKQSSSRGRARIALAIATGIMAYLFG